jgi:hypothetical protein
MAKRVEIVFLHEDTQHQSFGTAFLNKITRVRRIEPVRMGRRSMLVNDFPRQLKAVRSRGGKAALVVLIDADHDSVQEIREVLDRRLKEADMPTISPEDPIFIAIPKWRIENWIEYLRTGDTDEAAQGARLIDEASARPLAAKLHETCLNGPPLASPPPSLEQACTEWQRFRAKFLQP